MAGIPRIDTLAIRNFQSLEKADIGLGALTVIVGPSNSGKSALLRALKAVVRNVNSPSSVRVGKSVFTSEIAFGETKVSIERGKAQSTYRLSLPDGSEEVYTKAGRTVPEDIQTALALPLPEGPDLTFSSQIDPPFLLAETGTTAAKILGDLTNVSKLHAAAKEANRRRLEASRLFNIRKEDATNHAKKLREEFADLPEHSRAIREARVLMDSVHSSAKERDALSAVIDQLNMLESAEEGLRVRLEELPQPADIEGLAEEAGTLLGERHALLDVIDTLETLTQQEDQLSSGLKKLESEIENLESEHDAALKEFGQCPTCGQEVA